jgi:2,3-bisphosphoglycerate-independent phosphoglycerate mutase
MTSIHHLSDRVVLCILDGFGDNKTDLKNAILHAKKPNIDELFKHFPVTTITPGGEPVGLPKGVSGNSEVGHLNLGAGRPVRQDLVRINEAITNKTFEQLPRWSELISFTKNHSKRLHLMGLLSDGSVHSHINHLKYILGILKNEPEIKVYLHCFMDGRDTAKDKGVGYLKDILSVGGFTLGSLQGRSIGMDRDRRWEKIQYALKTMSGASGVTNQNPVSYMESQYQAGLFDEFITPALFHEEAALKNGDSLFFFNFRPDRARQITLALNDPHFKEFQVMVKPGFYLCMSPYVQDELPTLPILFDKEKIKGTLCEYLSGLGKTQFKIAETEKYAHVTYFFNGGEEKPFPGEDRSLIPSPKDVPTYDQKPQMSAFEVKDQLIKRIKEKNDTLLVVNFANADMVGHTGNFPAAVKAIEALDTCMAELSKICLEKNVTLIITADHGNADQMTYADGSPHTSHSEADVPFVLVHPKLKNQTLTLNSKIGTIALKDVAPTILYILGINPPKDFSGGSVYL